MLEESTVKKLNGSYEETLWAENFTTTGEKGKKTLTFRMVLTDCQEVELAFEKKCSFVNVSLRRRSSVTASIRTSASPVVDIRRMGLCIWCKRHDNQHQGAWYRIVVDRNPLISPNFIVRFEVVYSTLSKRWASRLDRARI